MDCDDFEAPEWEWPTGTGADVVLAKQRELAALIAPRIPVFLDVNFWINAREAMTGASEAPLGRELFEALRAGVECGKLFCPVTSDILTEFSKQPPELLGQTLALVDLLSLGVALVPHHERMAIEVEALLGEISWPDHPPVSRPVWTSAAFAFGYVDLPIPGPRPDRALAAAQRAWMMPPSRLGCGLAPEIFEARKESRGLADWLNQEEGRHAADIGGLHDAIRIELRGAASLIEGIVAREFRRVAVLRGEVAEACDVASSRRFGRRVAAMIAHGLGHDRNRRRLGSLYVPAVLHAAMRANRHRRMKANDTFDFRHAAAALPYCRLFLTDGPLRTLVTGGDIRLDAIYGCDVVSEHKAAAKALDRLAGP